MNPEMVAAVAAAAAAVISLANVLLTASIARRQESTKWTRDLLPDLVRGLEETLDNAHNAISRADWKDLGDKDREKVGAPEIVAASGL